ncbi:MAG: flagellar hook-basal body complex protein FliE [Vampirovibrio sp.]|jgi:flagellar hook-basal body complex protein FliE|nr:flagellar hook-basal body complex protein FliE [Vampirovibrio sp.]
MNIGYIPKLSLDGVKNPFQANMTGMIQKTHTLDEVAKPSFQNVLSNSLENLNNAVIQPDAMMHDAMTTGSVDVHDLMIANAKAELLVSITTQVATKVVQAYDKILQIQI